MATARKQRQRRREREKSASVQSRNSPPRQHDVRDKSVSVQHPDSPTNRRSQPAPTPSAVQSRYQQHGYGQGQQRLQDYIEETQVPSIQEQEFEDDQGEDEQFTHGQQFSQDAYNQ